MPSKQNLTLRQQEVLALYALERTSQQIATSLGITQASVRSLTRSIRRKLGVSQHVSITGLVQAGRNAGMI